ncbi:MAG: glycosyltransferase family 4 protein [Phycisphaeraceae bacterium]
MRILHVITRLIQGGAQQNTVLSCAAQVRAGHDVHLAFGPIYGPEGSLLDEAQATGATLHEIAPMRRAIHPWHDLRCYVALRRLIREIRPDIVHTHSSKAGILGRVAAWHEKVPVVIHTVHGLPFHDRQPRWLHQAYVALEKFAARRCHHLVAITPAMVQAFREKRIAPPDRFSVIPSGVDLSRFEIAPDARSKAREKLGLPPDTPVVAILARLDPLKGHDDLLDILPTLLERFPTMQMLFIGDGWHRAHLEQRLAQSGHGERVRLLGFVPHEQIGTILPAADVKVLPSYQEGQSRTLIEALLCGCGIVAYGVGGIPSICIEGQTGKLVPVGDRSALADAITWMLEHPDERQTMVEQGRTLVREKFSAEYMTRELESLYQRLIKNRSDDSGVSV